MATSTSIPISEYLQTSYRPDCDYIDGELKEPTLGTRSHAFMQAFIAALFNRNWRVWQVIAGTEMRVRIPDVCVLRRSDPADPVVVVAPLICIEVLAPDDSLHSQRDRVEDHFAMGVEHIWLIDPVTREAWTATPTGYDALQTVEFTSPVPPSTSPSPNSSRWVGYDITPEPSPHPSQSKSR
jgi:Uma2 family endonuclease